MVPAEPGNAGRCCPVPRAPITYISCVCFCDDFAPRTWHCFISHVLVDLLAFCLLCFCESFASAKFPLPFKTRVWKTTEHFLRDRENSGRQPPRGRWHNKGLIIQSQSVVHSLTRSSTTIRWSSSSPICWSLWNTQKFIQLRELAMLKCCSTWQVPATYIST